VSRCDVFTGVRLHAAVVAAAAHVPAIALEYQPKCRDFQASIGRERWLVRTDELTAGLLVDMTEELAGARSEHSRAVEEGIAPLRERLTAELHVIDGRADLEALRRA
jgi:polysaccharide pyruvyl transferase WcaK-like protein